MKEFEAHILVIDDDKGIRELVKEYLNENNYLDLNEFKSCATINKDCPKNRKTCKNNQNILVDKIFYKYSNKSFNGLDINGLNELIIS